MVGKNEVAIFTNSAVAIKIYNVIVEIVEGETTNDESNDEHVVGVSVVISCIVDNATIIIGVSEMRDVDNHDEIDVYMVGAARSLITNSDNIDQMVTSIVTTTYVVIESNTFT